MEVVLHGVAVTGAGAAARFTQLPWVRRQFEEKLGLRPYPGTFNVRLVSRDQRPWSRVTAQPGIEIEPEEPGACVGRCYPVLVNERIRGAIVHPQVGGYPPDCVEVIAAENLRSALEIADGAPVLLRVSEDLAAAQAAAENSRLRAETLAYLASHQTVSIATIGPDGPWASTVFYVNLGFTLYYLSEPKTQHARNIVANPLVAATINEDYRDWREIKGIQMAATCQEVKGKREVARALVAYVKKYPFVASFLTPGQFLRGMQIAGRALDVRLYRIAPTRLFYLDNQRGFSNRQELLHL